MDNLKPAIQLPLDSDILAQIIEDAKDFAFSRGLVFKVREGIPYNFAVTFIPFTLLPSPWPRSQFEAVSQLQKDINQIYHRVANDFNFLEQSLQGVCEVDEWTRRLWQIYERTYKSQMDVPSLCILRSDYILGRDGLAKQVEVNTISAGFGGVSPIVQAQHRFIVSKLRRPDLGKLLPENRGTRVVLGLAQAWKAYGKPDAAICFLIEDVVYNIYDQRQLELALVEMYGIQAHLVIRQNNADLLKKAKLDDKGALWIKNLEIAVVYMRTWYDPCQLPSDEVWRIREMVERSQAIKCPNIAWHLAGSKKIQQELARASVLEKFCEDSTQVIRMRAVFAGLYALEEEDSYNLVVANPDNFVVKPQREGGGNNLYGKDITSFMSSLPASRRREYIAMDLIRSSGWKNYMINKNRVTFTEIVNELGIFGYVLGNSQRVLHSDVDCGWIFRAKDASSSESGVAAGYGCLDSPLLV